MIAGHAVIQKRQFVLEELFAQLGPVSVPIAGELKEKRPVMTPVRQMEDAATSWQTMSP